MAEPRMPNEITDWMGAQGWGTHHLVWHLSRLWDLIGAQDRVWVQQNGGGRADRQQGVKGNGLDFLAMHRVMIRQLRERFPGNAALFEGWAQPPTNPDDPTDQVPGNGEPRPFNANMLAAVSRVHNSLNSFQSDDDLGLYLQTRLRPAPGDPGHLSNDQSTGIHDYLHNRFSDPQSDITMGNPMVNINNQRFWRLHGWIDARWSAFRMAKGLAEDDPAYQQALMEAAHHMEGGGHHHHVDLLLAGETAGEPARVPEIAGRLFQFLAEHSEPPGVSRTALSRVGIDAKLWCPQDVYVNLRPPVPNKVIVTFQVSAFLTNTSGITETLFAPTPCDVHYWELIDSSGRLLQSAPPEICIQIAVQLSLTAGETIRGDNTVVLDGKLLKDGERYTLRYQFWRNTCEDSFTVRLLF